MKLYLHADLCKAEAPTEVGKTKVARGSGVGQSLMRLKPTKTGSPDRKTSRMARDEASKTDGKNPYRCSGCGSHVIPGKFESRKGPMSADEVLDHEATGGEHHGYNKESDTTTLRHAPQQVSPAGEHKYLEMGALTSEMMPGKKMDRAGVQQDTKGKCPDCHSGVSKSLSSLDSLMRMTKPSINKGVRLLLEV